MTGLFGRFKKKKGLLWDYASFVAWWKPIMEEKTKPEFVTCPDCKGKGYNMLMDTPDGPYRVDTIYNETSTDVEVGTRTECSTCFGHEVVMIRDCIKCNDKMLVSEFGEPPHDDGEEFNVFGWGFIWKCFNCGGGIGYPNAGNDPENLFTY